jgi:hypothetical protein
MLAKVMRVRSENFGEKKNSKDLTKLAFLPIVDVL